MLKTFLIFITIYLILLSSNSALAYEFNPDNIRRFLNQSSFGPTNTSLNTCQKLGSFQSCLAQNFQQPVSYFTVGQEAPSNQNIGCPALSDINCHRDNYTQYPNQVAFFIQALTSQDQLRLKIAFTLHQIFQVSGSKIIQPNYYSPYLNLLKTHAFGNYRELLEAITLNPAMGTYLDFVNNDKPNASRKTNPNENYARELLQLFSIGEFWMNDDGSLILDKNKQPIATYDQSTIVGFARVFTGWTFSDRNTNKASKFPNTANYADPLVLYKDSKGVDTHHDKSLKPLLRLNVNSNPILLNANQDGSIDLKEALDNVFNHPNIAPFISKQIIQHLVTSNPSPEFIYRVSQAFKSGLSHGFGTGHRGDMQAIIAAILLDDEARDPPMNSSYGLWREPVIQILHPLRILSASSDGILNSYTKSMGQDLFYSPTVFNYYPHTFNINGPEIQSPEFGLSSDTQILARENYVYQLVALNLKPHTNSTGTSFNLDSLVPLGEDPKNLVNEINHFFLHGTMTSTMQKTIIDIINTIPTSNLKLRIQTALYLTLASGQYQVQR